MAGVQLGAAAVPPERHREGAVVMTRTLAAPATLAVTTTKRTAKSTREVVSIDAACVLWTVVAPLQRC
jgi:hypothetical protein